MAVNAPLAEGGKASTSLVEAADLLDAMPDATAVVDDTGRIVAVNHAWRMFAQDNGGQPSLTGIGVNYLEVCSRAAAAGCADAAEVEVELKAVLLGETVESVLDYPCPSPAVGRWFSLRATPIDGSRHGALISHTNITRRKMAELDLERRASQDPLTGLANRAWFTQRLEELLAPKDGQPDGPAVGVIYLDLDGFKPVNDTFGHAAGDEVLQAVATRLSAMVRPQDTVARLGGDEFAVLVTVTGPDDLDELTRTMQQTLFEPHRVHGQQMSVGASIGAVLAHPGDDPAHVVNLADQAMYAAKRGKHAS